MNVEAMFNRILGYGEGLGCTLKQNSDHTSIRTENHKGRSINVCEVHNQKDCVKFNFNHKSLSDELIQHCELAPESFGWTLDAIFKAYNENDLELAKQMISKGIEFRK